MTVLRLLAARNRWRTWALVAICLLAGLLSIWEIGGGQLGNTYYSAAVKSMTGSFSNFLFGSFDPYGVITVDKPPMALWPQVISVLIFGFHGWSLLLPQVIEGVAAAFLLHRTMRLWAGENVAVRRGCCGARSSSARVPDEDAAGVDRRTGDRPRLPDRDRR